MVLAVSGVPPNPNTEGDSDRGLDGTRAERAETSRALVVSRDGRLWKGVRSALGAALGHVVVEEVSDVESALDAAAERPAAIVVFAADALGADPESGVGVMAAAAPDAAIVVLGEVGPVQEEAVVRAGAQDVLRVGHVAGSDLAAMGSALRKAVLRQAAVADLRRESLRDPLTGLFNRRGLVRASDALVGLAARTRSSVLVLIWDVDGMKAINDLHGHPVGDRALQFVASTVRAALRSSDVVGRIGGDEFCAVAYGARAHDGDRIHLRVAGALDHSAEGGGPVVSASGGWAELDAQAAQPLVEAMVRADSMLYQAKNKDAVSAGASLRAES